MIPTPDPPPTPTPSSIYEIGRESAETRAWVRELQTWRSTVVDPAIELIRDMHTDVKSLVESRDERATNFKQLQTDIRTAVIGAIVPFVAKSVAPAPYQGLANMVVVGCAFLVIAVLLTRRRG